MKQSKSRTELLVTVATLVVFVIILFSQFRLVGGVPSKYKKDTKHCGGKGIINEDNTCSCYSGYKGPNCTLRYCPFGKSWASFPVADHTRYRPNVECSNMGLCNIHTGTCTCRNGYEGRACERSKCTCCCIDAT